MRNKNTSEFNRLLNAFVHFSKKGIDESSEKWILQVLDKLQFFTHLVGHFQFEQIQRLTVNNRVLDENTRIKNIDSLKYPPYEKVTKYGRCNLPKNSVFYGATTPLSIISELKPNIGDKVTISVWKLKKQKTLKFCPIFFEQPQNSMVNISSIKLQQVFYETLKRDAPKEMHESIINLSKFIAFQFSKHVNYGCDKDYIFSAYFANKILNELDGGTIDGIIYPSVKMNLQLENIALKSNVFDENYELIEVQESEVFQIPDINSRTYFSKDTNICTKFDFDKGLILWEENSGFSNSKIYDKLEGKNSTFQNINGKIYREWIEF
jgi:hypothetical protein